MQKITPFLWFDTQAEEAMNFYTSVFKDSRITSVTRYNAEGAKASGMPEGSVMTGTFVLAGQEFIALNGGPAFTFTEAVSFSVDCEDQEEVDYYWEKLSAGGDPESQQCGWLKDKYGLSWQIVPSEMPALLRGDDAAASERAMKAMLGMKKLDIGKMKDAYAGK